MIRRPPRSTRPVTLFPYTTLVRSLWILGSSTVGAQLAAMLGLPYAFASHFAPDALDEALDIYRRQFKPSAQLAEPYAAAAFNVFAADTREEAEQIGRAHV